jgi:hypothetical protein
MPKTHNIGPQHFVQVTKFPYQWGKKVITRGWTQETDEPYRTANPLILRLPRYRALVLGKWNGQTTVSEVDKLIGLRIVTEDEFTEEAGWTPPPKSDREKSLDDIYSRLSGMDGAVDVYDWQTYFQLAKDAEQG